MTRCISIEKYTYPRNPVVFLQIGDIIVSNVLIYLGVDINGMTRKIAEQLGLSHIHPKPTMLELADRSNIKHDGVLKNVVVSIDSWEYPMDVIVLQPKSHVGGHPLILG